MGIAITKDGNAYQTTSKGKLGAMAIGAGAGGYLAHKNVDLIKTKADQFLGRVLGEVAVSTYDITKGGMNGKIDPQTVKKNLKFNGKIAKYATKLFKTIKKHPVAIGAAAGAAALLGVGAIVDKVNNNKRAKKADFKA